MLILYIAYVIINTWKVRFCWNS